MTETTTGDRTQALAAWLHGRLPDDWFTEPVEVVTDRDEITVLGRIAAPETDSTDQHDAHELAEAARGRIARFREDTREHRIEIARELERRTGRKVAWGVRCADEQVLFTHLAVPVMTRLRQPERRVLDTLVSADVARSRADALAWCVRLVAQHEDDWLVQLRQAMHAVHDVRDQGPDRRGTVPEAGAEGVAPTS